MQDIVSKFSKWSVKFETELCTEYMGSAAVVWKQPVMQDIVSKFSKWSVKFETELCTEYMGSGMETDSRAKHC